MVPSLNFKTYRVREVFSEPGIIVQLADGDSLGGILLQHLPDQTADFR